MKDSHVRIKSMEITNFKNVRHGIINFENTRKSYKASVLGLYGQNGSGKTAVIEALLVLKYLLSGKKLPESFIDFINVDAEYTTLRFEFKVSDFSLNIEYKVKYEFSIRKDIDESTENTESDSREGIKYKAVVFDEILSTSYSGKDLKFRMQPIIETGTDKIFKPQSKLEELVGSNNTNVTDLLVTKKYVSATSRSFVFSKELINIIRSNCKNEYYLNLLNSLTWFGNYELFVIDTVKSGLITFNTLPLNFKYREKGMSSIGSLAIDLNEASLIPINAFDVVKKVVENMNIVLTQLVPGLTIGVKELGNELLYNGETGSKIQLVSYKNGKEIPLKYESEGIRKIISVLQLLIVVYNESSITVAVDELDSGIFEYLLGELLHIISEKACGQLIFTSHNLRPLETIDKGFIAFTTTNPDNRYIRFTNVKTNNNLRDFYYRDIMLGEQDEEIYNATNNYEISLAFREAGEISGS